MGKMKGYFSIKMVDKKKALSLSVNVFSTKVQIGDTIFMSPTGDGTRHLTCSSEPREGLGPYITK